METPAVTKSDPAKGAHKKQQQQLQTLSPAMIATPSIAADPHSRSVLGGVWIEGGSNTDDSTVISEITSDQMTDAGMMSTGTMNGYGAQACLEDAFGDIGLMFNSNGNHHDTGSDTTPGSMNHKLMPMTRSTAQSTPDRSVVATRMKAPPSPPTERIDDGSYTDQPSSPLKSAAGKANKKSAKPNKTGTGTGNTSTASKSDASSTKATAAAATKKKKATSKKTKTATARSISPGSKIPTEDMDVPSPKDTSNRKSKAPPTKASATVIPTQNLKAPPSSTTAAMITPTKSPTMKTDAKARHAGAGTSAAGAGLSELSKQLRVQRAKNEWQHNEIARLERQLRILSDLKGVSVADLRFSLMSACAEEAHDELRNQVMSLQAQLEAVHAHRDNSRRRASTATTEATQAKIATLQLRIGELEEVDETKRREIEALYQQLQDQRARATTLEAIKIQQAAQLEQFENVAKTYVQDVDNLRAERDALKEQVAELMEQMQNQQAARGLDLEMKEIEDKLRLEQHQFMAMAQRANGAGEARKDSTPVSRRISSSQLAAIQGVVGRQAGMGLSSGNQVHSSAIAVSTQRDNEFQTSDGSVASAETDDAEDDTDSVSAFTMDALMTKELSDLALSKDAKIEELYESLREQSTKAAQLQTQCANQKAQIEAFAQQLKEKDGNSKSIQSNYDFAKSEHDSLYKRFCDMELQLILEQQKVDSLERQLDARNRESELRNEQFNCRFKVQNERIADLEQQQQSLYAAFELLQQEVKAQDSEQNKLKSSLNNADGEVAKQLRESEKKQRKGSRRHSGSDQRMTRSQRNLMDTSAQSMNLDTGMPTVTATPVSSPFASLPSNDESVSSLQVPDQVRQQLGIDHPMQMYGYLLKLDKIKGWKRRFFVLYGEGGIYKMTYSDGPRQRVKGTIDCITMGVSTVAETNKSIKKPYSFVLHVDPSQPNAPVLYAAAVSAEDFRKWMTAFKNVTIRPEDIMHMSQPNLMSAESQLEADLEVARRMQSASARDLGDPESQIEADHLMAMRMQNRPNTAFA